MWLVSVRCNEALKCDLEQSSDSEVSSRLARFSLIVSLETHLNWYRMGLVG